MKLPFVVAFVLVGFPAWADSQALIIANENYRIAANITAADEALKAKAPLEAAGFGVVSGANLTSAEQRALLSRFLAGQNSAERIVILLSGHFAKSERSSWFLGVEVDKPDLATVAVSGLSLETVLEIASNAPGGAIVLLGTETRRIDLGAGLAPGIGALSIPQGVSVVMGDAAEIADFAAKDLPIPGQSLRAKLAERPELLAQGFLSALLPVVPRESAPIAGPVAPSAPIIDPRAADEALWQSARSRGTLAAMEEYLARYPSGLYALQARAEAERLRADPVQLARLAEEALQLSRDERREIQRHLDLIGFDPNGIDGLFGRGSRAAISNWQKANGFAQTSYLARDQITLLAAQADRKAAELEAAAAARQAEQDRADRLYWEQTGALGTEVGYRDYLRRYPDGLFARLAQDRLTVIEADWRQGATSADRAAWDRARDRDTIPAYEDYLRAMPRGAFVELARDRIAALRALAEGEAARAAAEAAEAALNLPVLARSLIEMRLGQLGFNPGPADGRFDDDTRRAIRRFQQARGLPVTGYLDQSSMSQLLAGSVFGFGD